jgi:hypothetical protein
MAVIGEHPEFGPELKQLAQQILVLLDPLIQAAAAFAPPVGAEPGKCQQVWCPVCAIAAFTSGEQHPLYRDRRRAWRCPAVTRPRAGQLRRCSAGGGGRPQ